MSFVEIVATGNQQCFMQQCPERSYFRRVTSCLLDLIQDGLPVLLVTLPLQTPFLVLSLRFGSLAS